MYDVVKDKITSTYFQRLLGTESTLPEGIQERLDTLVFSSVSEDENIQIIKSIADRLELLDKSGVDKQNTWETGWGEILLQFIESKGNLDLLIPQYFRENQPLRLDGKYIKTNSSRKFENTFLESLREWVAKEYLKDVDCVYEFGSGTGHNLMTWAKYSNKKSCTVGLDWSLSSVALAKLIGKFHEDLLGEKVIQGELFDMFNPREIQNVDERMRTVAITLGAMEQLGLNWGNFFTFLFHSNFDCVIHIEPLYELYNALDPFDNIAMRYHEQRNYLRGYLPYLHRLGNEQGIQILKERRVHFGTLTHEGWSLLIWRKTR